MNETDVYKSSALVWSEETEVDNKFIPFEIYF